MKNINITKKPNQKSNVFKLQILDNGKHTNEYVFAKSFAKAQILTNRRFGHRNVLSIERLYYG